MTQLTQNIQNTQSLDSDFNTFFSEAFNQITRLRVFVDDNLGVTSVSSHSNSEITGIISDGAQVYLRGTGFHSARPIINYSTYSNISTAEFMTVSGSYDISRDSSGFNKMTINNTQNGANYTVNGFLSNHNLDVDAFTYTLGDFSVTVRGSLLSWGYYDLFGASVIDEIAITKGNQTDLYTNLSYTLSFIASNRGETYAGFQQSVLGGNDVIVGTSGNDIINGNAGTDSFKLPIHQSEISLIRKTKAGGVTIESSQGLDKLYNIEMIITHDGAISVNDLLIQSRPNYTLIDGDTRTISPEQYTGSVSYLEFSYLGNDSNEVLGGSHRNDFINLLAGDDAANGGPGDDVLDGGIGSNFLSGGSGDDTFFLDGRSGAVTWSTVTDFDGDEINIWGWEARVSKMLFQTIDGAIGYQGATLHFDLDGDNAIDTSLTLTGLTLDELPYMNALYVEGNGYLLIA